MPSRRHSSAMLCSPRKPSSTTRIFSSAEYCFRVARRMSFTTCSDDALVVSDFCLIFASPWSYDEPEILPCSTRPFCLTSADGRHAKDYKLDVSIEITIQDRPARARALLLPVLRKLGSKCYDILGIFA